MPSKGLDEHDSSRRIPLDEAAFERLVIMFSIRVLVGIELQDCASRTTKCGWTTQRDDCDPEGGIMLKNLSLALALALSICLPSYLVGQSTGTLTGRVSDSQGAAVVGATVVAQNVKTNLRRELTTGEFGYYAFSNLPVGEYTLTVTVKGFKTATEAGIQLDVNQQPTVNIVLSIGT